MILEILALGVPLGPLSTKQYGVLDLLYIYDLWLVLLISMDVMGIIERF